MARIGTRSAATRNRDHAESRREETERKREARELAICQLVEAGFSIDSVCELVGLGTRRVRQFLNDRAPHLRADTIDPEAGYTFSEVGATLTALMDAWPLIDSAIVPNPRARLGGARFVQTEEGEQLIAAMEVAGLMPRRADRRNIVRAYTKAPTQPRRRKRQ